MDKQELIKEFEKICDYTMRPYELRVLNDVLALLKEQEEQITRLNTGIDTLRKKLEETVLGG